MPSTLPPLPSPVAERPPGSPGRPRKPVDDLPPEPVAVVVPRTGPRSIAPKALRSLKEATHRPRPFNPMAGAVTARFPATRALNADIHDLLVEVYGGRDRVPACGSLVTLADFSALLKWAPDSFRLQEPVHEQQPAESMEDYTLLQLYLRQSEFIPFAEGEARTRSLARFWRIWDEGVIPVEHADAISRPPQTYIEGLRKAWSWDYRCQARDARLLVADAESAASRRLRKQEAVRDEALDFILTTIRAANQCVKEGNPQLVKNYAGALSLVYGQKGASGFIMEALQHLDGTNDTSVTVTAPKGSAGALQLAWKPAGPPPTQG